MNRSVKEISKYLGTNKNVVYRIIDKLGLEPIDEPGTTSKVYSDESVAEIKKEYRSLQERHKNAPGGVSGVSADNQYINLLESQIRRYEGEIDRLNEQISQKDQAILELTDKLTRTVESSHLESLRYQQLLAREQDTKLLLSENHKTRFNIFKPSTWKRSNQEPENLSPLTDEENSQN